MSEQLESIALFGLMGCGVCLALLGVNRWAQNRIGDWDCVLHVLVALMLIVAAGMALGGAR